MRYGTLISAFDRLALEQTPDAAQFGPAVLTGFSQLREEERDVALSVQDFARSRLRHASQQALGHLDPTFHNLGDRLRPGRGVPGKRHIHDDYERLHWNRLDRRPSSRGATGPSSESGADLTVDPAFRERSECSLED
jgi:hypothetical protein